MTRAAVKTPRQPALWEDRAGAAASSPSPMRWRRGRVRRERLLFVVVGAGPEAAPRATRTRAAPGVVAGSTATCVVREPVDDARLERSASAGRQLGESSSRPSSQLWSGSDRRPRTVETLEHAGFPARRQFARAADRCAVHVAAVPDQPRASGRGASAKARATATLARTLGQCACATSTSRTAEHEPRRSDRAGDVPYGSRKLPGRSVGPDQFCVGPHAPPSSLLPEDGVVGSAVGLIPRFRRAGFVKVGV